MVGHVLEYHPAIIKLNELIKSGEMGNVKYIYSNRLNLGKFRTEEKRARMGNRRIDPDNIDKLTEVYLSWMAYKAHGCRSHSFVTYFSMLQNLEWVEPSGIVEKSHFQNNYPDGQPRIYFRLTEKGKSASDSQWANPHKALYG